MKFIHLLSRLTGPLWLITEDALANITHLMEMRLDGIALQSLPGAERVSVSSVIANGVATIPIHGVIGKRLSPLEMACGGADVDAIDAAFTAANADPAITKIVLDIDSPGGQVTGVPELARKIYDTKSKPVEARSDTLIGSAAYFIAASADKITVTPTARVGSIGAALQVREAIDTKSADGRSRLRIFRSGEDKLAGADGPLSKAQETAAQAMVDEVGALFRNHVTLARPGVKADSMTGLAYTGREARVRGLVDEVCDSLSGEQAKRDESISAGLQSAA